MASWLSSLETVLRLHSLVSWVAIFSAGLALACGLFAYLLSNKAEGLRDKAMQVQVEKALQTAARLPPPAQVPAESEAPAGKPAQPSRQALELERMTQDVQGLRDSLEQAQAQARQSQQAAEEAGRQRDAEHQRAEKALAEAAAKQKDLQAARTELDQLKASSAAQQATQQGPFSQHQKEKLLRALEGKPAGSVTLVSVSGNSPSQQLSRELADTLKQAGWTVELREGVFNEVPDGLYFVVQSQESMPQYTLQLAVGLAVIDLMPMPAKIRVNPQKPAGSLAIVVGEVRQ